MQSFKFYIRCPQNKKNSQKNNECVRKGALLHTLTPCMSLLASAFFNKVVSPSMHKIKRYGESGSPV